jgi:hypothetical protein
LGDLCKSSYGSFSPRRGEVPVSALFFAEVSVAARLLRAGQNDKRPLMVVEQISLDYRYLGATQKAAVAESAP